MAQQTKQPIGEQVKAIRISRGMTQAELADAAGLTCGAISQIEASVFKPRTATLSKIAGAFDMSLRMFFA